MRIASAFARAVVITFWLTTSAYAFLASVPFVYEQFLQPGLVPALVGFVRWHGWAALATALAAAVAVWPEIAARRAPIAGGALVWLLSLVGVAAAVYGPLAAIEPGPEATALGLASLVPVVWLAAIDLRLAPWSDTPRTADATARDAVVIMVAALVLALGYALMGVAAAGRAPILGGLQSATAHLLLFCAVFACLAAVRAVADVTSKPAQWEGLCAVVLLAGLVGVALSSVMLPAVSARDWGSRVLVMAFGASLALVPAARGLRHGRIDERDGVVLVLSGFLPSWARSARPRSRLAWALVLVALATGVRAASGSMDWNFVVAKLGAMTMWCLVLATATAWVPARVYLPSVLPFGLCAAALVAHLAIAGRLPFTPVTVEAAEASADAWAVGDPSFRALRDWLQRPVAEAPAPAAAGTPGMGFFDYLQAHTNISRSVAVAPVPVQLAPLAGPAPTRRPHIFVFVVDSLRRDYLSPYNAAVTFTPAIARFAAESTVFTRPFTRYGATGLSVPSIWVGGMVLHKQYVTPFAPMNTLHALLAHDGYRRWIGMDNILEVIMPRDASLDELDRGRGVGDFRLCSTIDELRRRLDRLAADRQPTFVWSLPQDIHVAVLNREGNAPVDDRDYGGFFAPYASRVRRFDACFGGFIDDLKARGLYDDSVIVLTADHGDSLGEEGRWGHAYTLYPEVVQVPLVVHLPSDLRERFAWNADAPAFTTDITPTLYALLGHPPSPPSPVFGLPLVWPKGTPPPPRRPFGLMASSYGSIYGWIDPQGRQMYIADGVALRDYAYDLDGSATGRPRPVTEAERVGGQSAIRGGIAAIADFYRFAPATP